MTSSAVEIMFLEISLAIHLYLLALVLMLNSLISKQEKVEVVQVGS